MTGTRTGDWRRIGCTALLTAVVAFPAGVRLAGMIASTPPAASQAPGTSARAPASRQAAGRNPYSANIRDDPFVVAEQRALVEAMERSCEQAGEGCIEAGNARRYMDSRTAK